MKHICSSTAHLQLLVLKEVEYVIHALENMVHIGGRYFNGKLEAC